MPSRRLAVALIPIAALVPIGSAMTGASAAAANPFCAALKTYNATYDAAYAKTPTDVAKLGKVKVDGLKKLARAAPAEIAPSVTAMATFWATQKGKLGPALLKVSNYADTNCKLPVD